MTNKRFPWILGCGLGVLLLSLAPGRAVAATTRVSPALGALAGMRAGGPAPRTALLRLAIELQPKGDLDGLAARMSDPAAAEHRQVLTREAFAARFGRLPENRALGDLLRAAGGTDVEVASDGLVAGAILRVDQAERLFHARWLDYTDGTRTVIAPAGPLSVPAAGVRDVRGAVGASTPRLADTRPSFTYFRGDWYEPTRFRSMTDAVADGGASQRIVLVEDASDRFDLADVAKFLAAEGAPPGADGRRVTERSFAFKAASSDCGRDDRGQEAALDVDSALTMAPRADVVVDYDDVCSAGNDGTLALARALDLDPSVLVFPFAVGPVDTTIAARWGLTPIPQLEALVRGIPLVVPAGDDGGYGFREKGIERPRLAWPCVSPYVVCTGGTQLGDRDNLVDEAPWNDLEHAGGGGISNEPRPAWQNAPGDFLFSTANVKNRIVPDLSADAAGHLRVFWHGYGLGGVGGTSESAALVGGQLAAINSLVGPQRRLQSAGDLYVAGAQRAGRLPRRARARTTAAGRTTRCARAATRCPRTTSGILPTPPPFVRAAPTSSPTAAR